jgi:hypothetical protein
MQDERYTQLLEIAREKVKETFDSAFEIIYRYYLDDKVLQKDNLLNWFCIIVITGSKMEKLYKKSLLMALKYSLYLNHEDLCENKEESILLASLYLDEVVKPGYNKLMIYSGLEPILKVFLEKKI